MLLEDVVSKTKAGVQKGLVVFAGGIQILHQVEQVAAVEVV